MEAQLFEFSERAGKINALLEILPEETRVETVIDLLVAEAVKTSAIEGEYLDRTDVMSSIKKNLGLLPGHQNTGDKRAEGIAELMTDAQKSFNDPLSEETLLNWHRMLMKGNSSLEAGKWRSHEEPMEVISGAMGREIIHYDAPPSKRVPEEMKQFISWFNLTGKNAEIEIKNQLYARPLHTFISRAYILLKTVMAELEGQ